MLQICFPTFKLCLIVQKFRKHPIQHRRHFLHTAEKLQDADWGWGRYDNTPLNTYPFTAATRKKNWYKRPQNFSKYPGIMYRFT